MWFLKKLFNHKINTSSKDEYKKNIELQNNKNKSSQLIFDEDKFAEDYPFIKTKNYLVWYLQYKTTKEWPFISEDTHKRTKKGIDLYNQGKWFEAYDLLKQSSSEKDPLAIAYCGLFRIEIERNEIEGIVLLMESISYGCLKALNILYDIRYSHLNMACYNTDFYRSEIFFLAFKLAVMGDPFGQCNVSLMFKNGIGIKENEVLAKKWLEIAVDNEDAMAFNNMGWMYLTGDLYKKNKQKAFEFFTKSAELGCQNGMVNLASCYFHGWGVQLNLTEAFKWNLRAANGKNIDTIAIKNLAYDYYWGNGVQKDLVKAFIYVLIYSAEENPSKILSEWLNTLGETIFRQHMGKAINEIFNKAQTGDARFQYIAGSILEAGIVIERNLKLALQWYEISAQNGYLDALRDYQILRQSMI